MRLIRQAVASIGKTFDSCYDIRRIFKKTGLSHGKFPVTRCLEHALAHHHLRVVRDKGTSTVEFRQSLTQLATLLAIEATSDLSLCDVRVNTPLAEVKAQRLSQRIGLIPILRAGIGMVDPVLGLIPEAEVWHLGLYRDEETAQPIHYYSKLPEQHAVDIALVLDPMLATGGSACMACQSLIDWGVPRIKMLSIIAAPEGIHRLNRDFPDVEIYACAVDDYLDENKFIVPGLGDAGDRLFCTE